MTEFEEFFEVIFLPMLARLADYDSGAIFSNGHTIRDASWDRKAAYLLWLLANGKDAP